MKIVIIEDEKATARDLERTLVAIEPDIAIAAILHSVEKAIDYFTTSQDVDLIFADIKLGDGLSFEIFERLELTIPIVFCTAFNDYYIEAFKTTGIDYILKPFSKTNIEKALTKFQHLRAKSGSTREDYKLLLKFLENKKTSTKNAVIIRHREKIIPLQSTDIAVIFVENGICYAYTFNQEKFTINENLEELEKSFHPHFFRANRQYLINRKAIKDASHFFNRKVIVNLTIPFKNQILVGKLKMSTFVEWLTHH
jgi:two-component system response regulator LytT